MKSLLSAGVSCLLAPAIFAATHRGGVSVAGRPGGLTGAHRGGRLNRRNFGFGRYGGYGYADLFGSYDQPFDEGYYPQGEAGQNVTVIYPSSPQPPPEAAPQSVHGVIHEYNQPSDYGLAAPGGTSNEPPLFLIAFRDNNIRAATTYWVADGTLHYMEKGNREQQAPLASIDRELSARLNRERNVPFNIP